MLEPAQAVPLGPEAENYDFTNFWPSLLFLVLALGLLFACYALYQRWKK